MPAVRLETSPEDIAMRFEVRTGPDSSWWYDIHAAGAVVCTCRGIQGATSQMNKATRNLHLPD